MKITIKNFDIETGEETVIEREQTVAEKKEREILQAERLERETQIEAKNKARQAIAEKLGLTADELQVLLG